MLNLLILSYASSNKKKKKKNKESQHIKVQIAETAENNGFIVFFEGVVRLTIFHIVFNR